MTDWSDKTYLRPRSWLERQSDYRLAFWLLVAAIVLAVTL